MTRTDRTDRRTKPTAGSPLRRGAGSKPGQKPGCAGGAGLQPPEHTAGTGGTGRWMGGDSDRLGGRGRGSRAAQKDGKKSEKEVRAMQQQVSGRALPPPSKHRKNAD